MKPQVKNIYLEEENKPLKDLVSVGSAQGKFSGFGTGREEEFTQVLTEDIKTQSKRTVKPQDTFFNRLLKVEEENAQEFGAPFTFGERFKLKNLRNAKDQSLIYNLYRNREENKAGLNVIQGYVPFIDEEFKRLYAEQIEKQGDPKNAITEKEIRDNKDLQFEGWEESFKQEQNLNLEMWKKRKVIAEERAIARRVEEKTSGWQKVGDFTQLMTLDLVLNGPVYIATGFAGAFTKGSISKAFMLYGVENALQGELVDLVSKSRFEYEGEEAPERGLLERTLEFGLGGAIGGLGRAIGIKREKIKIDKDNLIPPTETQVSDGITNGINIQNSFLKTMGLDDSNIEIALKSNEYRVNDEIKSLTNTFEVDGKFIDVDIKTVDLKDINFTKQGNEKTIAKIIDDFTPERLILDNGFNDGAIVIDKNYNIVSGNSRLEAFTILENADASKMSYYKDTLQKYFPHQDLSFETPILVKQLTGEYDKRSIKKLLSRKIEKEAETFKDTEIGKEILDIEKITSEYQKKIDDVLIDLPDQFKLDNIEDFKETIKNYTPEIKSELEKSFDFIQSLKSFTTCLLS